MRILITGGGGFIGSHLAEAHLEKGDEVYVIDDLSTGSLENIKEFLKNKDYRARFFFSHDSILNHEKMLELGVSATGSIIWQPQWVSSMSSNIRLNRSGRIYKGRKRCWSCAANSRKGC